MKTVLAIEPVQKIADRAARDVPGGRVQVATGGGALIADTGSGHARERIMNEDANLREEGGPSVRASFAGERAGVLDRRRMAHRPCPNRQRGFLPVVRGPVPGFRLDRHRAAPGRFRPRADRRAARDRGRAARLASDARAHARRDGRAHDRIRGRPRRRGGPALCGCARFGERDGGAVGERAKGRGRRDRDADRDRPRSRTPSTAWAACSPVPRRSGAGRTARPLGEPAAGRRSAGDRHGGGVRWKGRVSGSRG